MTVKVKVINDLTIESIVVKEGNGGVFREVAHIPPGNHHVVSIDPNATYREFVCVESERGHKITFTSDDCIEYEEVKITGIDGSKLIWNRTPRKSGGIAQLATDANISKTVKGVSSWFTNLFKKKTSSPQAPPPSRTSQPSVIPQPSVPPQPSVTPHFALTST